MNKLAFWNSWDKSHRNLFVMLLALLAGSIIYLITVMLLGAELVIDWQTLATLQDVKVPLYYREHPLVDISLEGTVNVVQQTFWGSELQVHLWPAYLLLAMVSIGLAVALAVITALRRFWYLLGIGIFCVIVVSLRLEQLQLFGRIDKTADIILFLFFLPLSYYFHAIRSTVSLQLRVLSFAVLFALMGVLIYLFSGVGIPFLYIANYGLPAFIGLSLLLIILVAPEIIAGILYLVTASNVESSQKSFTHFVLASSIYLLNLLLYYLEIRGVMDVGLYLISPFWILPISMLIALRTLKDRGMNFENVISYEPLGALLYLALGIICMGTIGYVFATANDPLVETFEDAVLYAHLGFGVLFFLYVIVNFAGLLKGNKRVYRVVYKPKVMPVFSARLMGLIAMLGLYSLHGIWAIYQPMGGYYNGIGDLYTADNNLFLAEQYYKLGSQHKYANHRSNYALASLARKAGQPVQAMLFLKEGIERQPTPYAYANLANLYFENNLYFDGLFILREGISLFPNEARLYNNLGVQFGKTNLLDSALYYLAVAKGESGLEPVATANELAILADKGLNIPADSLAYPYREGDIFYQNNLLALYNQPGVSGEAPGQVNPAALQELGGVETSWLLNYALLVEEPDSLLPRQLQKLMDSTVISYYEEPGSLALAILLYRQQDHFSAFRELEELAMKSRFDGPLYLKLLGSWALEQEAPLLASQFFGRAARSGDAEAAILSALALTEAGKPLEAAEALIHVPDSLLVQPLRRSKTEMLLLLSSQDLDTYKGNINEGFYKALRLQWGRLNREEETLMLGRIRDTAWKARALSWLVKVNMGQGNLPDARMYLQQLQQLASRQGTLAVEELPMLEHQLALREKNGGLAQNTALRPFAGKLVGLYAGAIEAAAAGDTLKALNIYRQLMEATPFVEEAYLASVPMFNKKGLEEEAYGFLLEGLRLNSYSVVIRELYILQSLRLGLESYAYSELENLRELLDTQSYEDFLQRFENAKGRGFDAGASW